VSEADAIALADRPATVDNLVADLRSLGVAEGATVLVHSSLSRLGYVCGGAQAVVTALLQSVGPSGTVAMPTHSTNLSDPAAWVNPPVPEPWCSTIRETMPAFDPQLTPTRSMGAIVECLRYVPGVRRSNHPTVSAAAVGPNADTLLSRHTLAHGLGESSPQARLYELDGQILLMGVTHANNTSLHLAEYRSSVAGKRWTTHASPVHVDGQRRWASYPDLEVEHEDFERLGDDFSVTGMETSGPIGAGTGRLMRSRHVVNFAVSWMNEHRR
jgi:aminoglycoside 3-N-acetyltransferase